MIAEGATITVTARLSFDCRSGAPPMALVVLAGGRSGDMHRNMRDALTDLAAVFSTENGSVTGVMDVLHPARGPFVLREGAAGRAHLAEMAATLSAGDAPDDHQWRVAISRVIPALLDSNPRLRPLVLIFNQGRIASPEASATPPPGPALVTLLAQLGGAARIVTFQGHPFDVTLCPGGRAGAGCRLLRPDTSHLPRLVGELLAELGGTRLTWWTYRDALQRVAFRIVPGSRQPAEDMQPPVADHALQLDQAIEDVVGTREVRYVARALAGEERTATERVMTLSPPPLPDAFLYQGEVQVAKLGVSNPTVCIFRPGHRAEDCGAFEAELPPTPTATPTATPSATPVTVTVTPDGPTATGTPDSGTPGAGRENAIYLPRVLAEAGR